MENESLTELRSNSQYLFHGTGSIVEEFEPRQSYNSGIPDGAPVIFASPFLDYAIFMALFSKENCPNGYRARVNGLDSGNLSYKATKASIDQIDENSKGYVYVFSKSDFKEKNASEWVSHDKAVPIKRVEVYEKDFIPQINDLAE